MATKVKPSRIQISGTPQTWDVPMYVDQDTFQWWAGWWGGGDVTWPASSTDWNIVLFDWATGKAIKDSWVGLSSKLDASALSNNNYWWAWQGDSTHTPTKWVLYDKIHTMDVEIWNKAADNAVVKLTWNQTIAWTKTFSTSPVVPSKTTDATNTWTAIATEAQVYKVDSKVSDLFGLWKFLSLWNATTWLPDSFPLSTPYTYTTWDYFLVETISSATPPVNYRPTGSSYTWTASTVVESDELEVGDVYIYDGSAWLLQSNHWKTVSFANIAWDPYDNTALSDALTAKQDELVSWTNIKTINSNSILWNGNLDIDWLPSQTWQSWKYLTTDWTTASWGTVSGWDMNYSDFAWDTATWATVTLELNTEITPSANFTVNAPATIKDWQTYILRVTNGATAYTMTLGTNITNPYSTDITLTANGVDQFVFLAIGGNLELQPDAEWGSGITKIFTLADTSDLTNAQAAYDWLVGGGNPIIKLNYATFVCNANGVVSWTIDIQFSRLLAYWASGPAWSWAYFNSIVLTVTAWTVTAISYNTNSIRVSSSAPASWTANNTITLVI